MNLLNFKLQFYFDILLRGAPPWSRPADLSLSEIGLCYRHFRRHTLAKTRNSFHLRSRGFLLASVELRICSFRHNLTWQKYGKVYLKLAVVLRAGIVCFKRRYPILVERLLNCPDRLSVSLSARHNNKWTSQQILMSMIRENFTKSVKILKFFNFEWTSSLRDDI